MALAVDIKMLGDKGLERMLRDLPDKVQKKVLRTTLRAVAKTARDEAVRRVPRKTGNLAAALKRSRIRVGKGRGKGSRDRVSFVYDLPTRDLLDIPADSKWYYPAHLEYGHGTVAARPYLRPAVDENLERFYKFMRSSMRIGIRAQALKLAKK